MRWAQTALVALVALLCYVFLAIGFDRPEILAREAQLADKLCSGDSPLNRLINGSGIDNIPGIHISTSNAAVARANRCADGPVFLGTGIDGSDHECARVCANSSARVIRVAPEHTVAYGTRLLQPGSHCSIGPRPECDAHNTNILMTVNSVACRSKFPGIIGGKLGTSVVACNNSRINDPRNVLWDHKNNEPFDATAHMLLDEDELLPGFASALGNPEAYRYRCHFGGTDSRSNAYQQHPLSRLHPIENYCASEIYRAALDVRTVFEYDDESGRLKGYRCECGEMKHLLPGNQQSLCSHLQHIDVPLHGVKRSLTIPYRCFTVYSPLEDVGDRFPCAVEKFTREGSQMDAVTVIYSKEADAVIEHPAFDEMPGQSGVALVEPGRVIPEDP